jgi:hypothetical protein
MMTQAIEIAALEASDGIPNPSDGPLSPWERARVRVLPSRDHRDRFFLTLWLFIIFVSVVDGFLVYEHRWFITDNEMNPMGRALLFLNQGNIWYLLTVKFIGTVASCGLLLLIHRYYRRAAIPVASAVAAFQLALLLFLSFA